MNWHKERSFNFWEDILVNIERNLVLKISYRPNYWWLRLFQPQAIDSYVTTDLYFLSRWKLFQFVIQNFSKTFLYSVKQTGLG